MIRMLGLLYGNEKVAIISVPGHRLFVRIERWT